MSRGFFGDLFDFNHDGELDSGERLLDFMAFEELTRETDEEDDENDFTELELSGLDPEELEMMGEDERREALEEAGLDPDEYDF